MFVIPISDDEVQSFTFTMDNYPATFVLKFPQVDCGLGDVAPVLDLFIDGWGDVLGIPLLPNTDMLGYFVVNGCLPLDIGALVVVKNNGDNVTLEELSSGTAILAYIGGAETSFLSMTGLGFGQ